MKDSIRLKPLAAALALAGCPWLCMAASFTVDSPADSGPGSLRAVLAEANATGGDPHDIHFALPPETTITLTSGQLEITRSMNLHGPGADELTISGNQQSRIFNIESAGPVVATISGMTLTNGRVDDNQYGQAGGAVRAHGNHVQVGLVDSVISGNENLQSDGGGVSVLLGAGLNCQGSRINDNSAGPAASGGGIFSSGGDISLSDCEVSGNTAAMGGGIWLRIGHLEMQESVVSGNSGATGGGGILLEGYVGYFSGGYPATAEIRNSVISANSSGGSGGCIAGYFAEVEIENSVVSSCEAGFDGGGINLVGSTYPFVLYGELTIVNSEISGNKAGRFGGGIQSFDANVQIDEGLIHDNESEENGGGLALRPGTLFNISDSVISGNKAVVASALWAAGQRENSSLLNTQVKNNEAAAVGTVFFQNGAFTSIRNTLISGNVTQSGLAGLAVSDQALYLANSTIAENQSIVADSGYGHALAISYLSDATVQHVTIAFNESGGTSTTGASAVRIGVNAEVRFGNTLIANNTDASGNLENSQITRHDTAKVTGRHNLVTHLPPDLFNEIDLNNQVVADPGIAPLADNGGRSRTVALLADSPAIDAGMLTLGIDFDQRGPGFPRLFGESQDIGAFEFGPNELGDVIFNDRFEN
ncbi:MAG: hypothetical protein EA370_16320 [Wenzhouxiangella sp.]|nr:MAG: hypothetical protein EA370_16320 [Wenzhouxiangella sp.]